MHTLKTIFVQMKKNLCKFENNVIIRVEMFVQGTVKLTQHLL